MPSGPCTLLILIFATLGLIIDNITLFRNSTIITKIKIKLILGKQIY